MKLDFKRFLNDKLLKRLIIAVLVLIFGYVFTLTPIGDFWLKADSESSYIYGTIVSVEENIICPDGINNSCNEYIVDSFGDLGEVSFVEDPQNSYRLNALDLSVGTKVALYKGAGSDLFFYDVYRVPYLAMLGIILVAVLIFISGIQGFNSLLALILSTIIVLALGISLIGKGVHPFWVISIVGFLVIFITTFGGHGFNNRSLVAFVSSLLVLWFAYFMAVWFSSFARLTGYPYQRASYLIQDIGLYSNLSHILHVSFVVGVLGLLDDVTMSQINVTYEIMQNSKFKRNVFKVFAQSMRTGNDHIASMVNTLSFAYISSAFAEIMWYVLDGWTLKEIFTPEFLAEECVRTIVGSIAIVLIIPVATMLAALWFKDSTRN
ncbi:YibE/F family protein [Candidatus Dojkabacteria bacterium]|nr:YibE/F family protein [Candidatus Dojkabacteria bacterium]